MGLYVWIKALSSYLFGTIIIAVPVNLVTNLRSLKQSPRSHGNRAGTKRILG